MQKLQTSFLNAKLIKKLQLYVWRLRFLVKCRVKNKWMCFLVFMHFYSIRKWINQQKLMLNFWMRVPAKGQFDITPNTPARKVFGSHLPSRNGAFRPTLFDIISGKARREYFGLAK